MQEIYPMQPIQPLLITFTEKPSGLQYKGETRSVVSSCFEGVWPEDTGQSSPEVTGTRNRLDNREREGESGSMTVNERDRETTSRASGTSPRFL